MAKSAKSNGGTSGAREIYESATKAVGNSYRIDKRCEPFRCLDFETFRSIHDEVLAAGYAWDDGALAFDLSFPEIHKGIIYDLDSVMETCIDEIVDDETREKGPPPSEIERRVNSVAPAARRLLALLGDPEIAHRYRDLSVGPQDRQTFVKVLQALANYSVSERKSKRVKARSNEALIDFAAAVIVVIASATGQRDAVKSNTIKPKVMFSNIISILYGRLDALFQGETKFGDKDIRTTFLPARAEAKEIVELEETENPA